MGKVQGSGAIVLGWMPAGSCDNSMTGHLNSYLKHKNGERLKGMGKEVTATHISKDRGLFGHFYGVDNVHAVSVFKHH